MNRLHRFHVVPVIPAELRALSRLGYNLWWSWNKPARDLFARIDPDLYAQCDENPVRLLSEVPAKRLAELAHDASFTAELTRVVGKLDAYLADKTWYEERFGATRATPEIAYFSMEFGIHECLPVYSGGLGVLAGDHLKSASDLGLPLVGIGIAFSLGYFRQSLDPDGWQTEHYPPNDWHDLPVSPVLDGDERVKVAVEIPVSTKAGAAVRKVTLQAWRVDVGRVALYLLDAHLPENLPEERALTNTLYGGDHDHRIRQELLLGLGGVRLLEALGVHPSVHHLNEGHSAFLAIERARRLVREHGVTFSVAREAAAVGNVFTTHTPVPAGNDAFPLALMAPYLPVLAKGTGLTEEEIMRLGRSDPESSTDEFSMPVLAIRMAERYNGVSELHGREARAMWRHLWPGVSTPETPIGSVTNGVHAETWVAPEMADLFDRTIGAGWRTGDPAAAERVLSIPDEELWAVHEALRARGVERVRARLDKHARRKRLPVPAGAFDTVLSKDALTIGFARRFATYKRGTLLFRDAERFARIVANEDRPVQLLFAGKAHPRDFGGKELIKELVHATKRPEFAHRIVFVEDYEMGVARDLVTGVDVWLNTPRRPLEASGTSGMKACMNGALHASILDGWWCEGYSGDNGFAIGNGEEYADPDFADRTEAAMLYRLLEEDLVPCFFERDATGLPRRWIGMVKRSIAKAFDTFTTHRMVREYAETHYAPAMSRVKQMTGDNFAAAAKLAEWKASVRAAWPEVAIKNVIDISASKEESTVGGPPRLAVGESLKVRADVHLGPLAPADVSVELYFGKLSTFLPHAVEASAPPPLEPAGVVTMACAGELGAGVYAFEGELSAEHAGEHAYAVRIVPHRVELPNRFAMALASWG